MPIIQEDNSGISYPGSVDSGHSGRHPRHLRTAIMTQPLWRREPAVIIGAVIAVITTIASIATSVAADLPANATWYQVVFVVLSAAAPVIQAKLTRGQVFSQATVERNIPSV